MRRVLVVDDEENIRLVLQTLLEKNGYDVTAVPSAEAALETVDELNPSFVLTDVRMGGMSGIELCAALGERKCDATIIVMSAFGSVDLAIEAMKAGAYDYVSKPFKKDEVLLALRKAEEREMLKTENARLREVVRQTQSFGDMLGQSPAMQSVFRMVDKVAAYTTTVLIQGESGTGKELVARAVHAHSPRAEKAFVAVNCGAIPGALLESELFGHKRGAFTDAIADKRGLFEEADGGTLFLDELGELPLALQVKLLRVLQEGTMRPVGGTRDVSVDVRVVAATVRDLAARVEEGEFREDLYYRLNVLQVIVPPLRERGGDVMLLLEYFVEQTNKRLGTAIRGVQPGATKKLLAYHWPGNVRELENLVERAVVLADSDEITLEDLPPALREPADPAKIVLASGDLSIKKMQRYMERELIFRALEKTGGNRTAASKLLEISHRALLYKLKDYNLK